MWIVIQLGHLPKVHMHGSVQDAPFHEQREGIHSLWFDGQQSGVLLLRANQGRTRLARTSASCSTWCKAIRLPHR